MSEKNKLPDLKNEDNFSDNAKDLALPMVKYEIGSRKVGQSLAGNQAKETTVSKDNNKLHAAAPEPEHLTVEVQLPDPDTEEQTTLYEFNETDLSTGENDILPGVEPLFTEYYDGRLQDQDEAMFFTADIESELPVEHSWELPELLEPRFATNGEMAEYLELLDETEKEAIHQLVETIAQTVHDLQDISEGDLENQTALEQELEELCIELLEDLNMKVSKELIGKFMKALVNGEYEAEPTTHQKTLDFFLMEEGTHEQKTGHPHLFVLLSRLIKRQIVSLALLGSLALQTGTPFVKAGLAQALK